MVDRSSQRVLSFIVMASSNEYSRKILNSPAHAEPCLVHSAKQILMPDNWVFLNGKSHVEYRKVLNTLFTRKALRSVFLIIPIIFFSQSSLQHLHWYSGRDYSPALQSMACKRAERSFTTIYHDDRAQPQHDHFPSCFLRQSHPRAWRY